MIAARPLNLISNPTGHLQRRQTRDVASYLQKLRDYSSMLQQYTDDMNELVECCATKAMGNVYAWVTE